MSFKINKDPQVSGSAEHQLELQIEHLKRTVKSPHDLIEHVIKLYGAEFIKANDRIIELQKANDELFRIKQKVVTINRELLQRIKAAAEAKGVWRVISEGDSAVIMCSDHKIADDLPKETAEWICAEHHAALFARTSVIDIEAHRVQAEDTPA
jgi:rRNA maturation endonuclease Nob1